MKQRFFFLISLFWLLIPVNIVDAQTLEEPGLDLIFIVDQSGSMSKGAIRETYCAPSCRTPPSDPTGLALSALPAGLDPIYGRLLSRELGRSDRNLQPEINRIGVILFGDNATVAVPLTEIRSVTKADGKQEANVVSQFPIQTQAMGDTSFSSAFQAACSLLECQQAMPAYRRRVLVLLTDGAPVDDAIDRNLSGAGYYQRLKTRTPELFADPNTSLWVLGIDQQNQFWGANAGFWQDFAPNRTRLLTGPADVSTAFRDIAAEAIGEVGEPKNCDGSAITVDPYLSSLYLVLTYENTDTKAFFTMPSGNQLEPDNPIVVNYTRTALTESFTIRNPEPGTWTCGKVGEAISAKFKTIQGDFKAIMVKAITVDGKEQPSTCRDFAFTVQYSDSEGLPLVELADFPLVQQATVMIDGQAEKRSLVPVDQARNQWKTQEPIAPGPTGGVYPIHFIVQLNDGRELFTGTSSVNISPELPCMQLETPNEGMDLPLHNKLTELPVQVRVRLTQGGVAKHPHSVFQEDLTQILTGTVYPETGAATVFQLAPADEPGIFTAQLNSLRNEGHYTLTINLNATTQAGQHYSLETLQSSFVRNEDPTYLLIQKFILGGKVLAGAIGLMILGWFIFLITPPYPSGMIVIEMKRDDGFGYTPIRSYAMGKQKLLGIFRLKRAKVAGRNVPKITGIEKITFRHAAERKNAGVEVVATGLKQKPIVEGVFVRPDQSKSFGTKYRIRYEK